MAKSKVYCTNEDRGFLDFYVTTDSDDIFLFRQKYRTMIRDYYSRGVYISEAINLSKARMNDALGKVMRKLPSYLKYAEKEYGVSILNKTIA